jgi:hypothetical protein
MKWVLSSIALVGLFAAVASAAPGDVVQGPAQAPGGKAVQAPVQAPLQAPAGKAVSPVQAPGAKAVQAPAGVQGPMQSPIQKGGPVTAQVDSGYRSFSYQPAAAAPSYSTYRPAASSNRPAYTDAALKALGRY